jgi:hypothetical protein
VKNLLPSQPALARLLGILLLSLLLSNVFAQLSLEDEGPYIAGDFITVRYQTEEAKSTNVLAIALAGAPLEDYLDWNYAFGVEGDITLLLPDTPDLVEVRLLEIIPGQEPVLLATTGPLEVIGVSASLSAPAQLTPGVPFEVSWDGPGGEGDEIALAAMGSSLSQALEAQSVRGTGQLQFTAPSEPGFYELRYLAGKSGQLLAMVSLEVVPDEAEIAEDTETCVGDEASLDLAFDREVSAFMKDAYQTYGDQYSDADYSYDTSTSVSDDEGRVRASYDATLTTIEGETVQASGSVEANFRWSDCEWSLVDYSY